MCAKTGKGRPSPLRGDVVDLVGVGVRAAGGPVHVDEAPHAVRLMAALQVRQQARHVVLVRVAVAPPAQGIMRVHMGDQKPCQEFISLHTRNSGWARIARPV